MALLNQEKIKEIIPNRAPFLLIDEIVELEPGVRAVGKKYLTEDDYWFKGHFPQEPVQPGVLTIEMLAATEQQCDRLSEQFKAHPEQIYNGVLDVLLTDFDGKEQS